MSESSAKANDDNPSAALLREILDAKLAKYPNQVYRLTPYESELLAQCGRERRAMAKRMIAEGFLDEK